MAQGAWVSQLVLAETVWVLDSVYGLESGADRNRGRHAPGARPIDAAGRGRDSRGALGIRKGRGGRVYRLPHRRSGSQGGTPPGRYLRQGDVTHRRRAWALTTAHGARSPTVKPDSRRPRPDRRARMGAPPPRRAAARRHEARRALAKRARPARRPYRTAVTPACGRNVGGGWGRSLRIGLRRLRAGGGLRPRRLDRRLDPRQPRLPIMGAARDHRRDGEATPSVDGPGRRATAGVWASAEAAES